MNITRNGMYAICGRPNVGKSTLLNALAGTKVAIVTSKPQTTRNRITAVSNRGNTQFVFIDTPGFHLSRTKLGDYMNTVAQQSVADVDAVLLCVEPTAHVGKPEALLIERIKAAKVPCILVINKMDTVERERMLEVIEAYRAHYDFDDYLPLAAIAGEGVEGLLDVLESRAREGGALFPDGMISDQPERQVISELVREKLLILLEREVPHGIVVEVERFEEGAAALHIDINIFCEKDSHKGIVIGKDGAMLKAVGAAARADIERFLGMKVNLRTWVKVKENWRKSAGSLRGFGFR